MMTTSVEDWSCENVGLWLEEAGFPNYCQLFCEAHKIDGQALLSLTEADLKQPPLDIKVLGDIKRLMLGIRKLQTDNYDSLIRLGIVPDPTVQLCSNNVSTSSPHGEMTVSSGDPVLRHRRHRDSVNSLSSDITNPSIHQDSSNCLVAHNLEPEIWKTVISVLYFFLVTWITAIVMVIVHDRVPDMEKYPPLPDIFLDNVPYIPWAFDMCEITACVLGIIWLTILVFHKHRFILLRRMFALFGSVFLLRCVTMLITSLSVPGRHLDCKARVGLSSILALVFAEQLLWLMNVFGHRIMKFLSLLHLSKEMYILVPSFFQPYGDMWAKMSQAFTIWRGAGMSLRGVRTCGDYMFSGHTVTLTMLNFFITEYTPRRLYYLHTFTWILNIFGIFFILAAHEHYSIDVFIAFYISTRLFLYYHTLANNRDLMQRDNKRTRIWFPLFSFFESRIGGIVPNEFENPFKLQSLLAFLTFSWFQFDWSKYFHNQG